MRTGNGVDTKARRRCPQLPRHRLDHADLTDLQSAVVIYYEYPFFAGIRATDSAVVIHRERAFRGGSGGLPVTGRRRFWVSPLRMMDLVEVPAEGSPGNGSPRTTGCLTRLRLTQWTIRPRAISRWESLLSQLLQRRVHHAMEAERYKTLTTPANGSVAWRVPLPAGAGDADVRRFDAARGAEVTAKTCRRRDLAQPFFSMAPAARIG